MNSASFFNELTEAIDRGVTADELAGLLPNDPLTGATRAWRDAARKCWSAWMIAQQLACDAYDLAVEARDEETTE
jgi:hypothetical protein